jgi:hypothetical protein
VPYTGAIALFFCGAAVSVAQDGTASLMGSVRDITGVGVSRAYAELQSENSQGRAFRVQADDSGTYRFSHLAAGEYSLKLGSPGWESLTIKSIRVSDSEEKLLPPVELAVVDLTCSGHTPDYLVLLPTERHAGALRGSVLTDRGPRRIDGPPIADAEVTLLCAPGKICGSARTDSKGEFAFHLVPLGDLTVRVRRTGFYPLDVTGHRVQAGFESVLRRFSIERCHRGNCDPKRRPKRPPAYCE